MHYILTYDYVADYLERRTPLRSEHLALAWKYHANGALVLGGVLDEPIDSALILFQAESPDTVHSFVAADPYVRDGLVKSWRVRPWRTTVGDGATEPVRVQPDRV